MTDLTLTAIQALSPEKQFQLEEYARKSLQRVQIRNRRISAAEREIETDPNFEGETE